MSADIRAATCDVVVIGGGVTGLWVRHALASAGYSVLLLESGPLGSGQTAASQGILHAGFKYAVTESAQRIADCLRRCREAWEGALAGRSGPDLRRVRVLAETMNFWSVGLLDRVAGVAAAGAVRSGVRSLARHEFPQGFAAAPSGVHVWDVGEKVIDPASLARELAQASKGKIAGPVVVDSIDPEFGRVSAREAHGTAFIVTAQTVVLTAGEGNAHLLHRIGVDPAPIVQDRPLHQVLMRPALFALYAHCLQPRPKPRMTVTTSTAANGDLVWYLGGDLAESGVARSESAQIASARGELAECMPWVDLQGCRFAGYRVNRAEARCAEHRRPEGPEIRTFGKVMAAWPTKLAMAPAAAENVLAGLIAGGMAPRSTNLGALESLSTPPIAEALCDSPDLTWV